MNPRAVPVPPDPPGSLLPDEESDRLEMRSLFGAIRRRLWLILLGMLAGAALLFFAASQLAPTYTAIGKVMLNPRDTRVVTEGGEVVPNLQLNDLVINSELSIIQSNVVRDAVVRDLGLGRLLPLLPPVDGPPETEADRSRRASDALAVILAVWREPQSYVISIAADTRDPLLSADIVNTVLRAYTTMQLSDRVATAQLSANWLENRTAGLRAQVETAEHDVEQYRGERLVEDGGSLEAASQQLVDLNAQLAQASAATRLAQSRFDQLDAVIRRDGDTAALDIIASPLVLDLRRQRSELSRSAADIEGRYRDPDHPELRRMRLAIAQIDAELNTEVDNTLNAYRNDVEVARRNETAASDSLKALEQRVLGMSQSAITLRQLEREAGALRGTYEELLSRLEETRTQVAVQQPDSRVIATALPPRASSFPRVKLLTALGGIVGAGVALALVVIGELSRDAFQTTGQLQRATGLLVFEALPQRRWRSRRSFVADLRRASHSRFAEQVRRIVQLLGRTGTSPRSIAITSSLPGEGRTTLSIALALAHTELGKSVVLIDCSRGKRRRRDLWQPGPDFDLADVLAGRCAAGDAIVRAETLGCDVLCAREPRRLDTKPLTRERMAELIAGLRERYDIVLIETPPAHLDAQALPIAVAADACLYLVRWARTPRDIVQHNVNTLRTVGAKLSGLVLTRVDRRALEKAHPYG